MDNQKAIFFAYEDGHNDNIDAIKRTASEYNNHQKTFRVVCWDELGVPGNIIGAKIFDAIDKCEKFSCDLTYLNHNVLFELGYAIAKRKVLKIFINSSIENSSANYSNIKILSNIGYAKFTSSKEILKELQQNTIQNTTLLVEQIIPDYKNILVDNDIFFINLKNKNQAAWDIEDYLIRSDQSIIMNNENEIAYKPLEWYLRSIFQSRTIMLHMAGKNKEEYQVTNAEYSLYAGFALGLGKNVLMVAQNPFKAPIDYTDLLIQYESSEDCLGKVKNVLSRFFSEIERKERQERKDVEYLQEKEKHELNMLKFGIGDGVAENEHIDTGNTFVEIDAYNEAVNRQFVLIIGRKGSGKSEIFLRLASSLETDKNNYNIIIKPDSDELLSQVELTSLYNNPRTKKSLLLTAWQYVVLSKIFVQIYENRTTSNLDEKDIIEIEKYYDCNTGMLGCNFYGMILYISKEFSNQNIMSDPSLLGKIKEKTRPMEEIIKVYFKNRKFQKITILADNLDMGWESKSDLDLQSLMINCLIEYLRNLNNVYENIKFHSVLFLRKDIFNYIAREEMREPDKILVNTFEINWEKFPGLLKNVLEKRLLNVIESDEDINDIWHNYFDLKNSRKPFDVVIDNIVKRPRDAIYFMARLFESAVNNSRTKVNNEDLNYAREEYTKFLYNNMFTELKAEFPKIELAINALQSVYSGLLSQSVRIPVEMVYKILRGTLNKTEIDELIKKLMENKYLLATTRRANHILLSYDEYLKAQNEKWLGIIPKHKFFINMRLIPFSE